MIQFINPFKTFVEAQSRLTNLSRQIVKLSQQNAATERDRQHAEITLKELSTFEPVTKTFKSVGKMFMRQDLQELKAELSVKIDDLTKESLSYQRAAESLKSTLGNTQDLVKDLIAAAKTETKV